MRWFLICGFSTRRRRCTKIWRARTGKINVFVSIRMTRGGAAAAAVVPNDCDTCTRDWRVKKHAYSVKRKKILNETGDFDYELKPFILCIYRQFEENIEQRTCFNLIEFWICELNEIII